MPSYIGEASLPDSYLKAPYFKPLGISRRHLPRRAAGAAERRRGAAARPRPMSSCASSVSASDAVVESSFHYHYARLIEMCTRWSGCKCCSRRPRFWTRHVRAGRQ